MAQVRNVNKVKRIELTLPRGERGFTLAELLLATAIAATLSVAVLSLFSGSVKTWQRLSALPRQDEVQRALLVLASDLRQGTEVVSGSGKLVARMSNGTAVRYRILRERSEDWLVRETLSRHGRWVWIPKRPLVRVSAGALELSVAANAKMKEVTLRSGRNEWTLHVLPREAL